MDILDLFLQIYVKTRDYLKCKTEPMTPSTVLQLNRIKSHIQNSYFIALLQVSLCIHWYNLPQTTLLVTLWWYQVGPSCPTCLSELPIFMAYNQQHVKHIPQRFNSFTHFQICWLHIHISLPEGLYWIRI